MLTTSSIAFESRSRIRAAKSGSFTPKVLAVSVVFVVLTQFLIIWSVIDRASGALTKADDEKQPDLWQKPSHGVNENASKKYYARSL